MKLNHRSAIPRPILFSVILCLLLPRVYAGELQEQIQQVEKLVQQSVGAKEVARNGNNKAVQLRAQALEYVQQARKAADTGDEQGARTLLNKAKMTAFQAMRIVGDRVVKQKKSDDYARRLESVKALREAYQRVAAEKNALADSKALTEHVEPILKEAHALKEAGQLPQAIASLDKAYLSVRLGLTGLREGDTLVRSLEFASKEEEFQYEQKRHKTLSMLVSVLLKEKLSDQRFAMMINIPLKQAEKLRQQAEQEAANGDYETAIATMEQATQQIIRSIRAAGIYIPG